MATAHHRERVGAGEVGRARQLGHRLLAGVDEVGVFLARLRVGSHAEHAVLGVQHDGHAGRHVVRGQGRHPDAEVHVVAVAHLLRRPADDALPLRVRVDTRLAAKRALLDPLLVVLPLEEPLDEDARRGDSVGIDPPGGDELLHLGDGRARGHRHHRREVPRRAAEEQVSHRVALPGLDERVVRGEGGLHHVGTPAEPAHLLALRDDRAVAGGGEEGGHPRAAGPDPLRERTLRVQLHLDLAGEEHLLEDLVLADVGRHHLLHLPVLQQERDAEVVGAGVVAHDGQVLRSLLAQRGDEVLGDPAQAETGDHDGRAVGDVAHRLRRIPDHLVHGNTLRGPLEAPTAR